MFLDHRLWHYQFCSFQNLFLWGNFWWFLIGRNFLILVSHTKETVCVFGRGQKDSLGIMRRFTPGGEQSWKGKQRMVPVPRHFHLLPRVLHELHRCRKLHTLRGFVHVAHSREKGPKRHQMNDISQMTSALHYNTGTCEHTNPLKTAWQSRQWKCFH